MNRGSSRCFRIRWRSAVLSADGPTTYAERLVAAAIAEHMNPDGGGAFPSERTLAACTALDRRKVRKAIEALLVGGWLSANGTRRQGRYGALHREYVARLPDGLNGAVAAPMPDSGNGAAGEPLDTIVDGASMEHDGRFNGAKRGFNGAVNAPDPETQIEPEGESPRPRDFGMLTSEREKIAHQLAPGHDPLTEWQKFTDWHAAKGKQTADVDAAWRNWLRKCQWFNRVRGPSQHVSEEHEAAAKRRRSLRQIAPLLKLTQEPNEPEAQFLERVERCKQEWNRRQGVHS